MKMFLFTAFIVLLDGAHYAKAAFGVDFFAPPSIAADAGVGLDVCMSPSLLFSPPGSSQSAAPAWLLRAACHWRTVVGAVASKKDWFIFVLLIVWGAFVWTRLLFFRPRDRYVAFLESARQRPMDPLVLLVAMPVMLFAESFVVFEDFWKAVY